MNDSQPISLPETYAGLLDAPAVRDLLADIEMACSELEIQVKGGADLRAEGAGPDIASAYEQLMAGRVHAVQLRYVYRNQAWCDTLLRAAAGFRLVRVNLDEVAALPK